MSRSSLVYFPMCFRSEGSNFGIDPPGELEEEEELEFFVFVVVAVAADEEPSSEALPVPFFFLLLVVVAEDIVYCSTHTTQSMEYGSVLFAQN